MILRWRTQMFLQYRELMRASISPATPESVVEG